MFLSSLHVVSMWNAHSVFVGLDIIQQHKNLSKREEGLSKTSVTKKTLKTKYKQAKKHTNQYDTKKILNNKILKNYSVCEVILSLSKDSESTCGGMLFQKTSKRIAYNYSKNPKLSRSSPHTSKSWTVPHWIRNHKQRLFTAEQNNIL